MSCAVDDDLACGRGFEAGNHAQQAWSCRSLRDRAGRRTRSGAMSKETSSTAATRPEALGDIANGDDRLGHDAPQALVGSRGACSLMAMIGGDDGDDDEHRRSGIDLGRHAAPHQRIDFDRKGDGFRPRGEEGDDEIVERQRKGEERAGDEAGHHEGHDDVPERLPFRWRRGPWKPPRAAG